MNVAKPQVKEQRVASSTTLRPAYEAGWKALLQTRTGPVSQEAYRFGFLAALEALYPKGGSNDY